MMKKEFVIEMDNTPGELARVCNLFGKNEINIKAITTERTGSQGFVRVITDNEDKTRELLENQDYLYSETKVLIKGFPDEPNQLAHFAHELGKNGINIDAIYLTGNNTGKVNVVFAVDDVEKAERVL